MCEQNINLESLHLKSSSQYDCSLSQGCADDGGERNAEGGALSRGGEAGKGGSLHPRAELCTEGDFRCCRVRESQG